MGRRTTHRGRHLHGPSRARTDTMVAPAQTSRPGRPVVSIVMAGATQPDTPARLDAMAAAAAECVVELIVVAGGGGGNDELAARLPHARFVTCPRESSRAELRAAGMRLATGDIIALVDDDLQVDTDWIAELLSRCGASSP